MRPTALSGGRAPRAWRRGIDRAVAPLAALRRSAAWLAGLARIRLGLQDGPLLGRCFHEIASQPFPTAASSQPEAQPKPTRPRLSEPPARVGRSAAPEPGSLRGKRQPPPAPRREETRRGSGKARAELPMGLEPQASREMLARLTGPEERSGRFPAASAGGLRPSPPAPLPSARPDRRERGEGSRTAAFPSISAPSLDPADGKNAERRQAPLSRWSGRADGRGAGGEGLARFRRALRRESLQSLASGRAGGALSGAPAPGREREGSSLAPTREDPSPSLPGFAASADTGAPSRPRAAVDVPDPWRLSLAGETAPMALLARWRTPGLEAPVRSARPAPARADAPPAPTRQAAAPGPLHQETTLLPPPPSLPPFLRTNGAGDALARHPMTEAKSVLAPPAGPAVAPAEDLDALAAKIQRILDDEARRHGIPV